MLINNDSGENNNRSCKTGRFYMRTIVMKYILRTHEGIFIYKGDLYSILALLTTKIVWSAIFSPRNFVGMHGIKSSVV